MIQKSAFISGVCEKIKEERLLENRLQCEGNVIGVLWCDPLSISEYKLSSDQFLTTDGRFYYKVAKILRERYKLNEFDEAAVLTNLPEDLKEKVKLCAQEIMNNYK